MKKIFGKFSHCLTFLQTVLTFLIRLVLSVTVPLFLEEDKENVDLRGLLEQKLRL